MTIPYDESQRLAALERLQILDTPADEDFDNLTSLACNCLQVPIALVSLVDVNRQWFKSRSGLEAQQTPRDISFCTHVVSVREAMIIEDAFEDERFCNNPLVTDAPHVRFYAGIPIHDSEQHVLGTFCVIDHQPRHFEPQQVTVLERLAKQAEVLIQLKHQSQLLHREQARYRAIVQGAAAGIVRIDQAGTIIESNAFTQSMLGYDAKELEQQNVRMLMPEQWSAHHDGYLAAYLETGQGQVIGRGREVEALHKDGHVIPVHLAVSAVKVARQKDLEFIGILSDLSQVQQARKRERQEKLLLKVLHRGLTDYHALISEDQLWTFLQEALCELTGSEYSLIGEVLYQENQAKLKIHAITDLSWSSDSQQLMQNLVRGDMTLSDPKTMLGRVFAGGEVVLSNQMQVDERGGHLPSGHPQLYRYLGVPIIDRGQVIGMYAIANASSDYTEEQVRWLKPFNSTCALLINLYRQLNLQQKFTEQLQEARDQAEQASQAKTEFLSSMSHELRTPLNSILGFAQLLESNTKAPLTERQLRQVHQIIRSGQHLLELINEVLDLARIESGHMQVSLEPIQLSDVMDEVTEIMLPIAEQYSIQLQQPVLEEAVSVLADYTRLKQVLINLVSNAVKYNQTHGRVWMTFESNDGGFLRVRVYDTGPGIEEGQLHLLFQPFNRLGAESATVEGTGVGLALTKKLVELMHGNIGVDTRVGEGSCFWFDLPLSEGSHALNSAANSFSSLQVTKTEGYQVLYVEDNPANQRLMQDVFDLIDNCQLITVHCAEVGLEVAYSEPPDLILMDIDLPGMNGFEAQRLLRDHPSTRHIPVIAVTAGASQKQQQIALEQGFNLYITKPFDIAELINHVLQLLNGEAEG